MIRIEPISSFYAAELSQLASEIFLKTFLPVNKPEPVHKYVEEFLNKDIFYNTLTDPNYSSLGIFDGQKLIGYIQLLINNDEVYENTPLELKRFYLSQDYHGRGIAQTMMEAVYELARKIGYKKFWLGVWEKNDRALRFYTKCGFRKVSSHAFDMGGEIQTDEILIKDL